MLSFDKDYLLKREIRAKLCGKEFGSFDLDDVLNSYVRISKKISEYNQSLKNGSEYVSLPEEVIEHYLSKLTRLNLENMGLDSLSEIFELGGSKEMISNFPNGIEEFGIKDYKFYFDNVDIISNGFWCYFNNVRNNFNKCENIENFKLVNYSIEILKDVNMGAGFRNGLNSFFIPLENHKKDTFYNLIKYIENQDA